jgi:hypothetical protein
MSAQRRREKDGMKKTAKGNDGVEIRWEKTASR